MWGIPSLSVVKSFALVPFKVIVRKPDVFRSEKVNVAWVKTSLDLHAPQPKIQMVGMTSRQLQFSTGDEIRGE